MPALAGTAYCTPAYFLNGFEWLPLGGIAQAQLDKMLSPGGIEGIEVYLPTSPHPARYETGAGFCGAVVIWTRGRK